MRLDKAVALAGLTRSEARKAIAAGRVQVDDQPVRDGSMQVDPRQVRVDGVQTVDAGALYIMVHKPAGVVTATEDRSLPTVVGQNGMDVRVPIHLNEEEIAQLRASAKVLKETLDTEFPE